MNKKYINIGFILSLFVLLFTACDDEYEAPDSDVNHAFISTSFGNKANRTQVNNRVNLMDFSKGVKSRIWEFGTDVVDLDYKEITSSTEEYPKIRFTTPGQHTVTLSQTYEGNVWIGETLTEAASYDTTITITVIDSVRANFTASRSEDMSALDISNGALNEIVAGRPVNFSPDCTGEPTDFKWQFIRSDGFVIENTEEFASQKFGSIGNYDVRFIPSSTFGADTLLITDLIQVIASTDPVDLIEIIRVDQNKIGLVFSRDMSDPFSCNPDAFNIEVTNGGNPVAIDIVKFGLDAAQNNIVLIEMDDNLYNSDRVSVSYDASVGNIITSDLMEATDFTDQMLDFKLVNVMDDNGYDVGFENSTDANWKYLWWGGNWGMYTASVSTANSHSGTSSYYVSMDAGGGAIFTHRDANNVNVTFPVEAGKTYEVGMWVYFEQLGDATQGDGLIPDLRFYADDWTELGYFFDAGFPVGEWVYISAEWSPKASKDDWFRIRGYNTSSSIATNFYMDDMIIFEKEVRP